MELNRLFCAVEFFKTIGGSHHFKCVPRLKHASNHRRRSILTNWGMVPISMVTYSFNFIHEPGSMLKGAELHQWKCAVMSCDDAGTRTRSQGPGRHYKDAPIAKFSCELHLFLKGLCNFCRTKNTMSTDLH